MGLAAKNITSFSHKGHVGDTTLSRMLNPS